MTMIPPWLAVLVAVLTFLNDVTVEAFAVIAGEPKVLVLGGTGFVGSEIVRQLQDRNIEYVATSTSGKESTVQLDLTAAGASSKVNQLAQDCTAVISTVGSIGTPDDKAINAATANAAEGAKQAGSVEKFVFIGNEDRVRSFAKNVPALQAYAEGKEESENAIRDAFGPDKYCIVQPNFIYGGQDLRLNPPRVPDTPGQIAEDILGLYPFQALAEALPGILGVAVEAPVSRDRVAAAAINAALGLCDGCATLGSRDEIILAASKRPERDTSIAINENVEDLKQQLFDIGDCAGNPEKLDEAFDLLDKIESSKPASSKPALDPALNGRWNFVFDVEPDMGTGVVKQILDGDSPIKPILDLQDIYMEISNQSEINIMVSAKCLGMPADVVLTTAITPDASDPKGTMLMEKFEGIRLGDMKLPVPESWKRSRPLEFSYMDEDMLIARGNGGEPHFLVRNNP